MNCKAQAPQRPGDAGFGPWEEPRGARREGEETSALVPSPPGRLPLGSGCAPLPPQSVSPGPSTSSLCWIPLSPVPELGTPPSLPASS